MGYPDTFQGFMISDQKKWTEFKKDEFKPKTFDEYDVDIKSEACGVCASDVHTINGGWGECPLPLCVGHEVIGRVVKTGDKVTLCKVGDRVGVGAQIRACLKCRICKSDNENYCPHKVDTYGAPYEDGIIAQGGFSSHIRAHEYFTFPIPDNIPTKEAAPMMCAGLTVWSPLVRAKDKVGPGKKVAIAGVGGLGHFALMFAKALGADVYALSHTPDKSKDAKALGAQEFVDTTAKDWAKPYEFTFDYILNTADVQHENLHDYMSTLAVNGEMHHVGLPDQPLPTIKSQDFTANGCKMGASHIGNRPEMLAMLKLISEKGLHPIIQTLDISEKGCGEAVSRVAKNDVRYRFTLVGFEKAFGN